MGQQQLLLVILVTIIVGIATVVAINIFGSAADQANRDAVRQDLMGASVQAQAIWSRPILMGGANRNFQGTHITVDEITQRLGIPGIITNNGVANENGNYLVTIEAPEAIQVEATPGSGGGTMVMEVRFFQDCGWGVQIVDNSTNQTSSSGCGFDGADPEPPAGGD